MEIRSASRRGYAHALVHADDAEELLTRTLPTVRAAVRDSGAQVVLAVSDPVGTGVREALDGTGAVVSRLTTLTRSARESGQTVAAWRARELRALSSSGRPVVLLCEHDDSLDGVDGGFWVEYEAALNISLSGLPVTQICAYPRIPLHARVGAAALANHPLLLSGNELVPNPDFRPADEVMATTRIAPPHLLGPPDVRLSYNTFELSRVRDAVSDAARAVRLDTVRGEDMVQAVNEVATNAVEHGAPHADLSVWAGSEGLVCEVHDHGRITQPLIGLAPPHPSQSRGRGTWIARQLCDSLHVWRAADGTHVRLLAHT
ncbi:ATP-binding protein [Pseudonocardia phyllosphaerae]|uniref:ATP-binding protein n=1 Tax=Pseudonocardia phyllosphaerae TaxID=3390502 RepID=UPI00397A1EC1